MFKVEVFVDNVYQGELLDGYKKLTDARLAAIADRDIYDIQECLYLISFNGKMIELWQVEKGAFLLKKDYLARQ